ncbi:hypothetical protein P154DRAFT_3476 [Amniculicola lignicola CBS 123094]|uniref:Uncharacterized protein n=1 Tax=Amniculicola lignicola CBS 123094 TaxID=1392246 RepID=A0A6A5X4C7_9PLEO|nr:hypothetical protein P154DRAFT_3476 [Amniculicola lignicola CBS 123094]
MAKASFHPTSFARAVFPNIASNPCIEGCTTNLTPTFLSLSSIDFQFSLFQSFSHLPTTPSDRGAQRLLNSLIETSFNLGKCLFLEATKWSKIEGIMSYKKPKNVGTSVKLSRFSGRACMDSRSPPEEGSLLLSGTLRRCDTSKCRSAVK